MADRPIENACIDLLRHGETAAGAAFIGHTDAALTATGWQQMQAAIDRSQADWQAIISSPLQRCFTFAQQLASERDVPLLTEPRWRELNFGHWEGRTAEQLMQSEPSALQSFWQAPDHFTIPGGEAVAAFRERVMAAWHACCQHDQTSLLVITHGGVIRTLLASLCPYDYPSMMAVNVPHASLYRLTIADATIRSIS